MNGPPCPWCGLPVTVTERPLLLGALSLSTAVCYPCQATEIPNFLTGRGWLSEVEMAAGWHRPMADWPAFSPFNPDPPNEPEPFDWT